MSRIPETHAAVLRLRARGFDDEAIAKALVLDPKAIPALLRIAEAKLAASMEKRCSPSSPGCQKEMRMECFLSTRKIAVLIAVVFAASIACAAALGVRSHAANQDQMDSCLRQRGWPYGLSALHVVERRVGHPNGLVRICERETKGLHR